MICNNCKYLIDSIDEVSTPMGSFPIHTRRCKKHETCGGEWCDKYEEEVNSFGHLKDTTNLA